MGRPRIGKRAMTPAERQRRRREIARLGITHSFLAHEERAWHALDLIKAHLDSLETTNDTHTLVSRIWAKELQMLCPAAPSMTVPTVVMMSEKKAARAQRKRRRRPPWGKLLSGKPIKRHVFIRDDKLDLDEEFTQERQYLRMLLLRDHYGFGGPVPRYPVAGLVDPSWLYWYKLALAIASELDDSLKIVDGLPRGKTAARWRGLEGAQLIRLVDMIKKGKPNWSVRRCLTKVQQLFPNYGRIPLKQFANRYHEARKHQRTTKRARNSSVLRSPLR